MKKAITYVLITALFLALATGICGTAIADDQTDTITVMVAPLVGGYSDAMKELTKEYCATHPNITVDIIDTTWDDHQDKLTTMCLAGEAPDIASIEDYQLGTYVEMGVCVNIADYMSEKELDDFDIAAKGYFTLNDTLYAAPLYITIQALAGNREMLEDAGVDVDKVQSAGWTYEEFLTYIKAGTTENRWGFAFANQGITTSDFVTIFGGIAGLNSAFTPDLKYAFTSLNMKNFLEAVEEITTSGSMPNYTVAAGERIAMLKKGEAMIIGKAMPLSETDFVATNEAIRAGTADKSFIEVEYTFLPMPAMDGIKPTCYGKGGALIPLRNASTSDEHFRNVMEYYYFISSGACSAFVNDAIYLPCLCESGREIQKTHDSNQSKANAIATEYCCSLIVAPPAGVTSEMSANAASIMNEVIVPKMELLIVGEAKAAEVYSAICDAAFDLFGEANCETGVLS